MRTPLSPQHLLFFLFALAVLIAFIQIGAFTIAFDKLGVSQESAFLLLITSLFGSAINLPLFQMRSEPPPPVTAMDWHLRRLLRIPPAEFSGKTVVAVNVGGCLIPLMFSLYLLSRTPLGIGETLLATAIVAAISRYGSRPIPGVGIGMPVLLAPVTAALTAVLVNPEQSAPLAYISGTLGVLIGADLLRLNDIRRMGTPLASIGGAGTFDGIFITGIVAVLLA